jgi:hypothetical protein
VYNHLRKWRQKWAKVSKLKDLSGALWDNDVHAIMLDGEHYSGHIKVVNLHDLTVPITSVEGIYFSC